ncbi:DNA (cytosine-5-)-methyltransferase [Actinomadura sp. NPDC000929]|uniref:DNA cytosine methyltransferase n=1 Tax=Actinomadura sp. NPDC000929 TaxID=3154517 RepID=UPI0033925666
MRTISFMELFAGCGGFSQGFLAFRLPGAARSPFRLVGAIESDNVAAATFASNFGKEFDTGKQMLVRDIEYCEAPAYGAVDVMLGGPPCQGFSGLGKRNVDDPRNKVLFEYLRFIQAGAPGIFVIENVDRFMQSPEYTVLLGSTQRGGPLQDYVLESQIMNAADYGIPQTRRRAIILGTHRDLIYSHPQSRPLKHPIPTHGKRVSSEMASLFEGYGTSPWVSVSSIFKKSSYYPIKSELPDYICAPLGTQLPGTFKTRELHVGRRATALSMERYTLIPPGGNRHNLPPHLSTLNWVSFRHGAGDVFGRMAMDRPAVTIRTEFFKPEKGRYLHPWEHRPITHYEAALIQGFPDDFLWCGGKIQIARQIGNAIPVQLSTVIAREIYSYLRAVG